MNKEITTTRIITNYGYRPDERAAISILRPEASRKHYFKAQHPGNSNITQIMNMTFVTDEVSDNVALRVREDFESILDQDPKSAAWQIDRIDVWPGRLTFLMECPDLIIMQRDANYFLPVEVDRQIEKVFVEEYHKGLIWLETGQREHETALIWSLSFKAKNTTGISGKDIFEFRVTSSANWQAEETKYTLKHTKSPAKTIWTLRWADARRNEVIVDKEAYF